VDLLYTEGISKSYGDFWALKNISIHVPEKSIFGLLGPNGAGKTTKVKYTSKIKKSGQQISG
jgi:ABC-type multidrug transport system ATPase subunit